MNSTSNMLQPGGHHALLNIATNELLDLACAAGRTILSGISDAAGAEDILVGASLPGQQSGRHCFDIGTGFSGRDKLHIVVDTDAAYLLRFTAGLGCSWQTSWMKGDLRLWCSTGHVRAALVPVDPDQHFHVIVEDGRLMIEEGLPVENDSERDAGLFVADGLVRLLMGRR